MWPGVDNCWAFHRMTPTFTESTRALSTKKEISEHTASDRVRHCDKEPPGPSDTKGTHVLPSLLLKQLNKKYVC